MPSSSNRVCGSLALRATEGAQYSGSLITARLAMEFNRRVYGVPGNITQASSFGPNQAIKQGANLVMNWQDVVEELPTEVRAELFSVKETSEKRCPSLPEASLSPPRG